MMSRDQAVQATVGLLRVVSGLLFLQAGGMKLFGWFGGMPPNGETAKLLTQTGIGGVLEVVGGTLMILGLFARPVAFVLSGEMAVAYWQFQAPNGFWPIQNHGESAVYLCFIFLFLSAFGAGEWSLDARLKLAKAGGTITKRGEDRVISAPFRARFPPSHVREGRDGERSKVPIFGRRAGLHGSDRSREANSAGSSKIWRSRIVGRLGRRAPCSQL